MSHFKYSILTFFLLNIFYSSCSEKRNSRVSGLESDIFDSGINKAMPINVETSIIYLNKQMIYHQTAKKTEDGIINMVADSLIVKDSFFDEYVFETVNDWHNMPFSEKASSFEYYNYLLPYKIANEYPDDWRYFFKDKSKIKMICDSLINLNMSLPDSIDLANEIFYSVVNNSISNWLQYDSEYKNFIYPSLTDILTDGKGGCIEESYLSVYMLRTIGIPSTVDFVPLWGSRNSGHSTPVFWSSLKKKMIPPTGRGLQYRRPAKVFRYIFQRNDLLENNSKKEIISKILPFLYNSHLYDVTSEYSSVSDVEVLNADLSKPYFIFCYNYGQWQPVYFSDVKNDKVIFSSMGSDVLYRTGFLNEDSTFQFSSMPFILDKKGEKKRFIANTKKTKSIIVKKLNDGSDSFVKKNESYSISYMNLFGNFSVLDTIKCENDSIINFTLVPENALYKVDIVNDVNSAKLSRPFTYNQNTQQWF